MGKNPAWIKVRKIRYLVKIGFDHEEPGFYSADAMPKNGCGVEIMALELPDRQPCWTFGYEAFGDDDKALSNLRRGVELSLKGCLQNL